MKIRTGFVSNSSSSSFIVIDESEHYTRMDTKGVLDTAKIGCTEFGWAGEKYNSIFDRINFAFIQTDYGKDYNRLRMLEEVLKEGDKTITKIVWNITDTSYDPDGKVWGYIDRCEGMNMEMFESKETLKNFIFGLNSYIQGGNDNS